MTAKLLQEMYGWLDSERKPRLEGWATVDKAMCLMATAWALRPLVAVEIGVWAGRSALPVALSMRETGRGVLHAIDPWTPIASAEGYEGPNAEWWLKSADHQYAHSQFNSLINDAGLFHFVKIHAKRSDDVEPPDSIDLLHIDGQHTTQAQRDVARFGSKVRVGGICFMDDASWQNEGIASVRLAIDDLQKLGFVKLYSISGHGNDCEVLQRVK